MNELPFFAFYFLLFAYFYYHACLGFEKEIYFSFVAWPWLWFTSLYFFALMLLLPFAPATLLER
jgi:hypothetical protein